MKLIESISDLAYYFLRPHLYVLGPGDKFDCPNGHASDNYALGSMLRAMLGGGDGHIASDRHVEATAMRAFHKVVVMREASQLLRSHD